MEITKQKRTYDGTYLRFVEKYFKTNTREGIWEMVERKNIYTEVDPVV
jgi:hypothetical protein